MNEMKQKGISFDHDFGYSFLFPPKKREKEKENEMLSFAQVIGPLKSKRKNMGIVEKVKFVIFHKNPNQKFLAAQNCIKRALVIYICST